MAKTQELLGAIYGSDLAEVLAARLEVLIDSYAGRIHAPSQSDLSSQDAILITYADQVQQAGQTPLVTLADFCRQYLAGVVSGIHILPFYPWSSDDGFSVVDYRRVDPDYGTWEHITLLGQDFRLMLDAVINHLSAQSAWFRGFLAGDPQYSNYFISIDDHPDLSQVVRPRTHPLLTQVVTVQGERAVWTTFSSDQVDLNFANPEVLFEILDVLLGYAARGAEFIRLDAIAYLWKEIGTSCIHHPKTHQVIQLVRAVLDEGASHVRLITETNVPHADNVSYFGDGFNEAQLVYNFALPPLVLHAFLRGTAEFLTGWAGGLKLPSPQTTFFNFLASHDGIGLNPARGLLPDGEIVWLVSQVQAHGGLVSYKANPDGTKSPYELNVNYYDALNPEENGDCQAVQVDRFLAAHAILLSFVGLPGIYFHSLFGSRGWPGGVAQTGHNRSINREKLERQALETALSTPDSMRARVFEGMKNLLKARATQEAFDPAADQQIYSLGAGTFALRRSSPDGMRHAYCLHNVSNAVQSVDMRGMLGKPGGVLGDLLSTDNFTPDVWKDIPLQPYQVRWLVWVT